ncbi:MAG: histidine phosphatase family protein [Flavobacteriaceae bacterium]
MKTLILVRHGKSSWEYEVSDKDRPLKERGINDAHLVGRQYSAEAGDIDAAFSSPACRAMHTAMIVLREFNYEFSDFRVTNHLYDFSGSGVADFVHGLDNQLKKVVIFGHNYAFTNIANQWGDRAIDNVPTAGLVELTFDCDRWADVQKGTTKKVLFPKNLR